MQIENVSTRALQPYAGNARTHSKKQIRQIARSIERFGFCSPVLVGDDLQIIAGHGRVAAAKLLGLAEVPIVRLSHLNDAERRAYVLADNKLAENGGWDREMRAVELQGLIDLGISIEDIGFEVAEVDLILDEVQEASGTSGGREDVLPATGHAVSQPGDLWLLGPHRLMCGDARRPAAYATVLDGQKAHFVFTDPPYNVPIDGHVGGLGRIRHGNFAMGCGEMTEAQFTEFLAAVMRCMAANSVDGSIHQICMDWRHMSEMLAAGRQAYGELKNVCVWAKTNAGMG
jgi:hypothetical protein